MLDQNNIKILAKVLVQTANIRIFEKDKKIHYCKTSKGWLKFLKVP